MWQMHNKYHREGAPCLCLEERKCLVQEKKTILENDWWVRGRGQPRKHSGQNWEHWCDPLGAPSVPTITTCPADRWGQRKGPPGPPTPLFPLSLYHFPFDHYSWALGRWELGEGSAAFWGNHLHFPKPCMCFQINYLLGPGFSFCSMPDSTWAMAATAPWNIRASIRK